MLVTGRAHSHRKRELLALAYEWARLATALHMSDFRCEVDIDSLPGSPLLCIQRRANPERWFIISITFPVTGSILLTDDAAPCEPNSFSTARLYAARAVDR